MGDLPASLSKSLLITREESITAIKQHAKEAIKARRTKEKIGLISKRTDFIRRAEQDDRARCAELRSQITKAEADLELQLRENGRLADERAQLSAQNASLYHEYDRIWEEIDRVRLELAEYQAKEERLIAEKEFLMKDIKREYEASHEIIRTRVTTYYKQKADEMRRIAEARASDELKHRRAQIAKMEGTIGDLRNKFRPLEDRNHLLEKEYNDLQLSHRLSGFRVSRVVDGMERSFTFPPQFVLHAGQTVLISANLHTAAAHGHHHTFALDLHNSWGVSPQTITYLYDSYGREVARFELKTV
ncbi:hypothetical protein COOONC_04786 [Cooperia oncophora]